MKKIILASFFLLALFVIFAGGVSAGTPNPSQIHFNGKARWNHFDSARSYNIYYKEDGEDHYTHSVTGLNAYTNDFSIKRLKRGRTYWYRVSAINRKGHEVWITSLEKLPEITH